MFKHLKDVKMGYLKHLFFAWGFGFRCLSAFFYAILHGLFPFLWETKSSDIISDLNKLIEDHRD